jgi:hypothetical protein
MHVQLRETSPTSRTKAHDFVRVCIFQPPHPPAMLVPLRNSKAAPLDLFPSLAAPRSPRSRPANLAVIEETDDEKPAPLEQQRSAPTHTPRFRVKPSWALDTITDEE